jgi:hypothetical protein
MKKPECWTCNVFDNGWFRISRNKRDIARGKRGESKITVYNSLSAAGVSILFEFQDYIDTNKAFNGWLYYEQGKVTQ